MILVVVKFPILSSNSSLSVRPSFPIVVSHQVTLLLPSCLLSMMLFFFSKWGHIRRAVMLCSLERMGRTMIDSEQAMINGIQ